MSLELNTRPEPLPKEPSWDSRFNPACLRRIAGRILPVGRGTVVADRTMVERIYVRRDLVRGVDPDLAVVDRALAAVRRELQTRPTPEPRAAPPSIDDYNLQVAAVELAGEGLDGLYYYIAGSCRFGHYDWAVYNCTMVSDGGSCFFEAFYSPAAHAIVQFDYHGVA